MADNEVDIDLDLGKGGTTGRMMLVVGILAGAIIGGVGAFFYFQGQDSEEAIEETTVEEQVEEVEEEVVYSYLYVERMPASLVDENGRTVGYVFLDFTFELLNSEDQSYVSARMPRVKDAMLRAISRNGLTRPGSRGELDYDRVSKYLAEAANEAVNGDYIQGIYITRALRAPS